MTYALLQQSMDPPPVDALRRAFRNSRSLAAADAMIVADDAFGILARDIPEDEAQNLAAMLQGEGVAIDLVAENQLPRLPDPRFFLSPAPGRDHLELHDAVGRVDSIPWAAIRLIAVGHDQRDDVRLELVAGDSVLRFFTMLGRLHFNLMPDLPGRSSSERLAGLVRMLHQRVPGALLNRGAQAVIEDGTSDRILELTSYPRHSALIEEMTWLLWRARQMDAAAGAGA